MACTIGFRADMSFDAKFLPQLATQAVLIGLSSFHFAAGKLPLQRKGAIAPPLANQELTILLDETGHYHNRGCGTGHIGSPFRKVQLWTPTMAGSSSGSYSRYRCNSDSPDSRPDSYTADGTGCRRLRGWCRWRPRSTGL